MLGAGEMQSVLTSESPKAIRLPKLRPANIESRMNLDSKLATGIAPLLVSFMGLTSS